MGQRAQGGAEAQSPSPSDWIQLRGRLVPQPPPAAYLLVAIACLVLAGRRRWPVSVLTASTGAVAGFTLLGYINGAALVAPALALYAVATQVSVRRAIALAAATMAGLMTATGAANPFGHIAGGGFVLIPGLVAAPLFAGIAVANRRAHLASVHDRAQEDARRRGGEGRLRTAPALRDRVAHTLATIKLQARAAPHALSPPPEAPAPALPANKAA